MAQFLSFHVWHGKVWAVMQVYIKTSAVFHKFWIALAMFNYKENTIIQKTQV